MDTRKWARKGNVMDTKRWNKSKLEEDRNKDEGMLLNKKVGEYGHVCGKKTPSMDFFMEATCQQWCDRLR